MLEGVAAKPPYVPALCFSMALFLCPVSGCGLLVFGPHSWLRLTGLLPVAFGVGQLGLLVGGIVSPSIRQQVYGSEIRLGLVLLLPVVVYIVYFLIMVAIGIVNESFLVD